MNGFLLTARCAVDDVPVGLYPHRLAVMDATDAITPEAVRDIAARAYGVKLRPEDVYSLVLTQFCRGIPQNNVETIHTYHQHEAAAYIAVGGEG